jgi:hypothetical protein
MQKFMPKIREIAKRISETEGKRQKLAEFLKEVNAETKMVFREEKAPLEDMKIVAVDGGIVKKSLHGIDCLLARAAGVCFYYSKGRLEKVDYHPSRNPAPQPEFLESLSDIDWSYFASITRLRMEIKTAVECIERFSPDILLLDGQIIPHHMDRPAKSSPLHEDYEKLVDDYRLLFSKAGKTIIAGVVEDSRSSAFCSMVDNDILSRVSHNIIPEIRELLGKTRDTNLLHLVLDKNERTGVLRTYSENPIMRDFQEYSERVGSFYLKTAEYDRPLRVDFLAGEEEVSRLASVLLSLSGHHPGYGIPIPIIEADNIAKLSEIDMENFYSSIQHMAGNAPSLMRLRRDQRPF